MARVEAQRVQKINDSEEGKSFFNGLWKYSKVLEGLE
jgi:hypothetical protein